MTTLSELVQQAQLVQKENRTNQELAEALRREANAYYQPKIDPKVMQTTHLDQKFVRIMALATEISVPENHKQAGNYQKSYVILAQGRLKPPARISPELTIETYLTGKVELSIKRKIKSRIYEIALGIKIPPDRTIRPLIDELTSQFDAGDEKYNHNPRPRARSLRQQLVAQAEPGYTYVTFAKEQTRHNIKVMPMNFFAAPIDFRSPSAIAQSLQKNILVLGEQVMSYLEVRIKY